MAFDPAHFFQLLLHVDDLIASGTTPGATIYLLLFAIIFCEIAFLPLFFLPGDPLLFVCGAFCAAGLLQLSILMPVLLAATILGSVVNYGIGRAIGARLTQDGARWISPAALARTRRFYEARGRQTFLVSPYIAVVRTFAPFVAGVAAMPLKDFVVSVCAGALAWVVGLLVAGNFFGNVPWVRAHVGLITLAGLGVAVIVLISGQLIKLARARV